MDLIPSSPILTLIAIDPQGRASHLKSWARVKALVALSAAAVVLSTVGCGSKPASESSDADQSNETEPRASAKSAGGGHSVVRSLPQEDTTQSNERPKPGIQSHRLFPTESTTAQNAQENQRTLGNLLEQGRQDEQRGPPPVDEARVNSLGIQLYSGEYLDLYTDVRDPVVQEYVDAFDQAVPQWAAYFDVDVPTPEQFHIRGSLMQERERFAQAGLLPQDLPPFLHGFQRGHELWVVPQPGPYFSRHLVLHEGTHAFMNRILGGGGPPWYLEGMAELLATHRWEDGKVQIRYRVPDRDEAPYWGRVKVVQDGFAAGEALPLARVLQYDWRAHLETASYGWSWAACAFFDGHPEFRERFLALKENVADSSSTFSDDFVASFGDDWERVREQWQLFVAEMEYGYDVERSAVIYRVPESLPVGGAIVEVEAQAGWQSTGFELREGSTYQISASGRFQVGQGPTPWWCEANGITLEYYQGRPLGMLVGAIANENLSELGLTPLATPFPIGNDLQLTATTSGVLFLRLNDSPAGLADNQGSISVQIRQQ